MNSPHRSSPWLSLVRDDKDLVGLVAYGLYVREQSQFALQDKSDLFAGEVPIHDLPQYYENESVSARYRLEAEELLRTFSEFVLEDAVSNVNSENKAKLDLLERAHKGWWRSISENVVANMLAGALISLVAVVLYGMKIGIPALLADMAGYTITEKATLTPAPASASSAPPLIPPTAASSPQAR